MARLSGKVAFVTGAGGGIGSAICARFLAEGARVAAADIRPEAAAAAIESASPGHAISLDCDAGDNERIRAAIAQTATQFGTLDVLRSVAGGSTPNDGPVTEAPDHEFWRVIRLDLFGTFLVSKHGIPELIKAGGGSVINLTSMGALVALPERDCYTSAKGGVAALTRSVAAGYGHRSVRVNAIAPGITPTPRTRTNAAHRTASVQQLVDRHVLGVVEPEAVADMAVCLASDESRFVTGQVLSVDSGVTISY